MKHPFLILAAVFASLMCLQPVASAKEGTSPAPAVTAAPNPAPAAPTAPAAETAPVTARKEEEDEKSTTPGASEHATRMGFLKTAVAKAAGITTDPKLVSENQRLASELSAAQASLAKIQGEFSTLQANYDDVATKYAEQSAFVDQLAAAPATLPAPAAKGETAPEPVALTPAQQAVATAISASVANEIRTIGQPATQLPGPGAEKPNSATVTPLADKNSRMAAYWVERGLPESN